MDARAAERLNQWVKWLPKDAPDPQIDEMFSRWQRGIDPPQESYTPDWPANEIKTGT